MWNRLLLAGLLMAGMAAAQRGGGGGPQGPRGDESGGDFGALSGRPFQANRLDRITDMLKLSKDQKNGAKEIFDAAQKEAAPVRDEIQKSRSAIATAYLQKQGQPEIDQMVASYGTLMAQMAGIEIRAFVKLVDTLTPDQQKKVGPLFPQMAGMFSGRDWNRVGN